MLGSYSFVAKARRGNYNKVMSRYMTVLMLSGVVPLAMSFWPPLKFYRYWRSLALSIALIMLLFGSWDVWATWRGHWYFDGAGVLPYRIINLPLEELLFFVVIPFCCIFTWEVLRYLMKKKP